MKLSALIIDDEPAAREGLAVDVRDIPYMEVAGLAASAYDAFELVHKLAPSVVFLDIDMPGMSGLEFIGLLKVRPLVILTTAYREYALESYALGVLDYLLKPISPDRLRMATDKALTWLKSRSQETGETGIAGKYIVLKCNGKLERIDLDNILYFEGANNYVFIYTTSVRYLCYITLKGIEEQLPPEQFVKVHKSYIISKQHIRSMSRSAVRINGTDIPLGKTFRSEVKKDLFNGRVIKKP